MKYETNIHTVLYQSMLWGKNKANQTLSAKLLYRHRKTVMSYPVLGENEESKVNFSPFASWTKRNKPVAFTSVTDNWQCECSLDIWQNCYTRAYLIFYCDLCAKRVICVPLLDECQTIFCPFVLCFQASSDFTGLGICWSGTYEFLKIHKENCYYSEIKNMLTCSDKFQLGHPHVDLK